MKTTFKWLASFFALTMVISAAIADEPSIPSTSWEQHSEGIALALTLRDHSVIIHIKNTSKTPKKLLSQGPNMFVLLFYINDQGSKVMVSSLSDPARYEDIQKNPSSVDISPDGELSKAIAITPDELVLIKTHSLVCSVVVYDPATKQQSTIESSPKILTETVTK